MSAHQWAVMATYLLTDAEARALHDGAEQRLDAEHRASVDGPGCLNCEESWTPELAASECRAPWYELSPDPDARVRQA